MLSFTSFLCLVLQGSCAFPFHFFPPSQDRQTPPQCVDFDIRRVFAVLPSVGTQLHESSIKLTVNKEQGLPVFLCTPIDVLQRYGEFRPASLILGADQVLWRVDCLDMTALRKTLRPPTLATITFKKSSDRNLESFSLGHVWCGGSLKTGEVALHFPVDVFHDSTLLFTHITKVMPDYRHAMQ